MAQSVIGALRVNLGLDSAKFTRGLTEAQKNLNQARKQFAAVAGVAAAMGAAVTAAALAGARDIDKTAKAARRLDSSIGGFRALELAAGEAGVSLSGLANDVQTMNRELASIGKSGNGQRALDALGISIKDLQGLDADAKLAAIADQVKALGLDAGQTTAILRDLGIRNREMALLVLGGGEAIRAARDDIKAYGLEITKVESAQIERANDQLGRLGLITQYAGQQLALSLVPAMGALAEALTNSLKEGGALRAVIDGLVNNMDRLSTYVAVAVAGFGVRYVAALGLAAISTASLSGALLFLRGALLRTGIGVLVVGAGELVFRFARLVKASGGWGNALEALGDLAAGVWAGITKSAEAIPPAMSAIWEMVASSFYGVMSRIQENWSRFLGNLGADMAELPGMGSFADKVLETSGKAASAMSEFDGKAQSAANSAAALKAQASALAVEGFEMARAAGAKLAAIVSETSDEVDGGADATDRLNDALEDVGGAGGSGSGGSAGKAGKALEKVKTEAEAFNDALKDAAKTSEDVGTDKAQILVGGIDGIANAFGDFISGGLSGFKDFTKSIIDGFKGMISQMIALAARNRIMIGLGIAPSGLAGAAGAGPAGAGILGGGGGGAGGLLGGLGSGFSNFIGTLGGGSGLLGGLGTVGGAFLNGGIANGIGAIGSVVSGATSGIAGLGAAIGAVALPIAAVAAVFSFFKKKTKELDAGLRVTVDGMETLVESFSKVETKRFWGLSKKVRTSFSALDDEAAGPLERIVGDIQGGVLNAAASLGVASGAFADFGSSVTVSTKGLSDADAQKAVEDALTGLADDFAALVPGLQALQIEGEGAHAALQRLSQSLVASNTALDSLGGALYEISLSGAAAASALVQAFGGLEQFNSATAAYYSAFYSEQERLDTLTRQLTETLGDLGKTMPQTRAQFRALVEAQDLATESGRQMFAALVSLAGQFNTILPAIDSLTNKLGVLVADAIYATLGPIDAQIEASNAAATQAKSSAVEFFKLADSLRAAATGIGGIQSPADLAQAGRDFSAMFAKAISGDVDALGGLGQAGGSFASESAGFAASAIELRRIEASIAGQLNQAAAVSEALGLGADYQALLYNVQTAALEETRALLTQGNVTQEILQRQADLLENVARKIVDSTDLQISAGRDSTGKTLAALVDNAGEIVGSLSAEGARAIVALQNQTSSRNAATSGQNGLFSNAITGQTASVTGTQDLTNKQLGKVRDLQGETVSITELVERAVAGNENLTSALLNRLSDGISVSGIPSMVSGLSAIGSLISRIVAAQEASAAAAAAAAAREEALNNAQRELAATAKAQGSAVAEVTAASKGIYDLAAQYGVYVNARSGPLDNSQSAEFGVNDQGLFQAKYGQITIPSGGNARGFKDAFYADGGAYSQTYGRAGELKALAERLNAQRQQVIDLGGIPQFATGGRHSGGWRIVGERGPELEYTGASQILNAGQTQDLLAGGGGDVSDVRRLLLELVKNTKRTSDTLREWNVVGQPETRGV